MLEKKRKAYNHYSILSNIFSLDRFSLITFFLNSSQKISHAFTSTFHTRLLHGLMLKTKTTVPERVRLVSDHTRFLENEERRN